jgi:hypothetical protein
MFGNRGRDAVEVRLTSNVWRPTSRASREKNKPGSRQPRNPGSLTTCLASVALCTRSRRRIAGTFGSRRASHTGGRFVRGLRRHSFRSPPWSDHVGRITRGVMNVSSSELAFVPVPPGRTCVSPGILASGTDVEFPLHPFEPRRSLFEDQHTAVRGLPFRYRRCGVSSEQLLLCRDVLANIAYGSCRSALPDTQRNSLAWLLRRQWLRGP